MHVQTARTKQASVSYLDNLEADEEEAKGKKDVGQDPRGSALIGVGDGGLHIVGGEDGAS